MLCCLASAPEVQHQQLDAGPAAGQEAGDTVYIWSNEEENFTLRQTLCFAANRQVIQNFPWERSRPQLSGCWVKH